MNTVSTGGLYNFESAFFAPVSTVMGLNAEVQQVVADEVGIPEDHTFVLAERVADRGYEGYIGDVTFVDWEGDNPSAQVAEIQVDIYAPGFLATVWAKVRGREPRATVNVAAYGAKPLGGGEPRGTPDDMPSPDSPARELTGV